MQSLCKVYVWRFPRVIVVEEWITKEREGKRNKHKHKNKQKEMNNEENEGRTKQVKRVCAQGIQGRCIMEKVMAVESPSASWKEKLIEKRPPTPEER